MTDAVAVVDPQAIGATVLEDVIVRGDLSALTPERRVQLYMAVCKSLGLNPLTKPFLYIHFDKKGLQLYATRDATDQLRKINGISVTKLETKLDDEVYIVIASGVDRDGRTDQATGAVPLPPSLRGEARANALMKAETKAKRRLTLSISGLGWLDEVEVESIDDSDTVNVDHETGEILPSTWEGRVRIGSRAGGDYVLRDISGDPEDPDEAGYQELARAALGAEEAESVLGTSYAGFKLELPGRKSAQVIAFGELAESLFTVGTGDDPSGYGGGIEEVPAFEPGTKVRVVGKLEFVDWNRDGVRMPPFRRIVAQSIERQ